MIRNADRSRQHGAALLLMMLVVTVGAAAVLVTKLDRNLAKSLNRSSTQAALATAKDALLDYAATYPELSPGAVVRLPCPDIDAAGSTIDGEAHTSNCGAIGESVIGRLPWRSLGIAAQQDGAGECLWYAVSGEYKNATGSLPEMLNPDSNGQFQLFESESGSIVAGGAPEDRLVAVVIAANDALPGQSRQAISQPGQQCANDFTSASFLDTDSATTISNATVGPGQTIDQFVRAATADGVPNDRIVTISRKDLEDILYERHDFDALMRSVTSALAKCVAAYGLANPGGPDDRRLPWPGLMALADYRRDDLYDDTSSGLMSGRLADIVADSNVNTGNSIARTISDCSSLAVPEWSSEMLALWRNWKDHFYYIVAESFSPLSPTPSNCVDCISVNASGQYAAVVMFANKRLDRPGQTRNSPPLDADSKHLVFNYLEGLNMSAHPYTGGPLDLESRAADATFNDVLFCIDTTLSVSAC